MSWRLTRQQAKAAKALLGMEVGSTRFLAAKMAVGATCFAVLDEVLIQGAGLMGYARSAGSRLT